MNNIDLYTFMTNAQISFGIALIAFLLALHVLGVFKKDNKKR